MRVGCIGKARRLRIPCENQSRQSATTCGFTKPRHRADLPRIQRKKSSAEERLRSLRDAVKEAERLNKALKVGRAPTLLIDILQAIDDSGLAEHFTVVGTHALYAYETAAGVRIEQAAMATLDVDLLWDARKKCSS